MITQGILPYKNGSIFWRSRSPWLKIGAFLPVQYLWICFLLHIQKINGKRKPTIDLWVKRPKVILPATLSLHFNFWRNIFMPLNHRCIQHRKQMKDDDWQLPDFNGQKGFCQGQYRMLSNRALCLCNFFVNSARISAPYMQFVIKVWWIFYCFE